MQKKYLEMVKTLYKRYLDIKCDLNYGTPFQLLVAVMMSAQCTDKRVNLVTPSLFEAYPTPFDMSEASLLKVEELIHSTGFYHNKSKNIISMSRVIVTKYLGELPKNQKELIELPGVGRKTANVIMGELYKVPAVVVDTHVKRLSNLIGLSSESDVVKIESDIMRKISKKYWIDLTHLFIRHGRAVCVARRPKCIECEIKNICKNAKRVR
ncbi:MAG: endonuclease III [Fusobacteria bacterium]|nr:endonuclease III [Fusobacteriota bacterium]